MIRHEPKERKFLGEKMTDFERNLFLKKQVKELLQEIKLLKSGSEIRERDLEIGVLKSQIDELRHKLVAATKPSYQAMTKTQKKNLRHKAKDVVSQNMKDQLKLSQEAIINRNNRIQELENELEHYKKL